MLVLENRRLEAIRKTKFPVPREYENREKSECHRIQCHVFYGYYVQVRTDIWFFASLLPFLLHL